MKHVSPFLMMYIRPSLAGWQNLSIKFWVGIWQSSRWQLLLFSLELLLDSIPTLLLPFFLCNYYEVKNVRPLGFIDDTRLGLMESERIKQGF